MEMYYFNGYLAVSAFIESIGYKENTLVSVINNGRQYCVVIQPIVKKIDSKPSVRMVK